jgi:predicted CXXCH cytochrome family protein
MKEDNTGTTHPPFASGDCATCHDPHASSQPGMIVDAQETLCLACHSDLDAGAKGVKSKHAAFTGGMCSSCHSPHKAKLPKLLLAQEPDLCLSCHGPIGEALKAGTAHPPAESQCTSCHLPHFAGEARLLAQRQQTLCAGCHDVKEAAFSTAHLGIDASVMNCVRCHDPHGSKDPKLFKPELHAPFAARSCEECHVVKR